MIASLYAGISGLNANATAMTVIGDNIANVNTTGFKSNRAHFANILSTTLGGESVTGNVGRGVEFWGANTQWTQGSLENTSNPTDLAINGKGFFIVKDRRWRELLHPRRQLHLRQGRLSRKPGRPAAPGLSDRHAGRLRQHPIRVHSRPTDFLTLGHDGVYLRPQPELRRRHQRHLLDLHDGLRLGGQCRPPDIHVHQSRQRTWSATGSIPSTAGTGVTFNGGASMAITFDENGVMTAPAADVNVGLTLTNGAASPLTLSWDMYDVTGVNHGDVTGFAADSGTTFQYQNGYPAGTLRTIEVDEQGFVTATYSNGQMTPLFQVALADFSSYDRLTKMGNNLYMATLASGAALPGTASTGRLGNISPRSLEMSNVDLAEEFVKMITTQRAFQANSKVITTSDEILQDLINIKR